MKQRRLKAVAVSAVVLLAAVVAVAVLRPRAKHTENPAVPVKVAAVELNTGTSELRYSATIIPRTEVQLAFNVGGYVDALRKVRGVDGKLRDIQEGDVINVGTVLARVRQSDYQVKFKEAESQASQARSGINVSKAQYEEAVSGIASSNAQLVEAEAAYMKAKLDFDRAENLFASRSMTKADFDSAKAQYDMTSAKVAAARSQVHVIQAKADSARANIDVVQARSSGAEAVVQETQIPLHDTELRSPLNGVVLQKSVEKGTLVSSGDKAFVVADTSSVKAVFGVADIAVAEMKPGSKLSVKSESMPGKEFEGQITAVFPAADSKSRAFNVEVTIANPEYLLRPNMIVSLRVGAKQTTTAQPVVPLNAVIKSKSNANGYAVIVVAEDGGRQLARIRDVKLGESFGNSVAVAEGLKQGDRVIITGGTMVNDGDQVKVIP